MPAGIKGRGASFNPPNRFEEFHLEPLEGELEPDGEEVSPRTTFLVDSSKSILAKNDSPDLPFTYSLNPYRGCEHGCIYCYARPSHEYLGFSAGVDFETKILVKSDAPRLLAETFDRPSWEPEMVCISGNTDCYQPAERRLRLTRGCLEVFLRYRNPVGIITKNSLVMRDLDLLRELALLNLVSVTMSVTSLDPELSRRMEPRTSIPSKRLEAISALSSAGIPVTVFVAPVVPGLTDEEIPAILAAAASCGASWASYTILRLPGPVEPLFIEWLEREYPARASKVLNRIRGMRGGKLSESRFGVRMKGEGESAKAIKQLFALNCRRLGLNRTSFALAVNLFRRTPKGQTELFG